MNGHLKYKDESLDILECCSKINKLVIFVMFSFCWVQTDRAQATDELSDYNVFNLRFTGNPNQELLEDFDRDGSVDIALWDNRVFQVFFCEDGRFSTTPSQLVEAPADAVFLDVGVVSEDAHREPVFMTREGVFRMVYENAREGFKNLPVLEFDNQVIPRHVSRLVHVNFLCDITCDGKEDIVVPERDRYVVYQQIKYGSFVYWGEIPIKLNANFYSDELSHTGRLREIVHFPRIFSGRGAGGVFTILYDGTWVKVYGSNAGGVCKIVKSLCLDEKRRDEYEDVLRAYFGKIVFFENLNNNDNYTLIITDNKAGTIKFLKGIGLEESLRSEMEIKTHGAMLKPVFTDLNGDGLKDLILPSIKDIGIFTVVRVFITSRIDINYMIFFNRKIPTFKITPDISRSVSLPLSISMSFGGLRVESSLIHSFDGDFNNDGINDLLLKSSSESLGVFFGKQGVGFSKKPDKTIPFKPLPECLSVRARLCDMNWDGVADVILHQISSDDGNYAYDLYLSR